MKSVTSRSLQQQRQAFTPSAFASRGGRALSTRALVVAQASKVAVQEPLMVRASRGEVVERAPCWMMRQAGRCVRTWERGTQLGEPALMHASHVPVAGMTLHTGACDLWNARGDIISKFYPHPEARGERKPHPPQQSHWAQWHIFPWSTRGSGPPSQAPPLSPFLRFQKTYRELAKRHPSFRERSETTELIVEISLQPWNSFHPDGVILFSDILTPLPALGVQVGSTVFPGGCW